MRESSPRWILVVAGLTCAGIAIELAFNRHWTERSQLIAWVALALVVACIVAAAGTPNAPTVRIIRLSLLVVLGASLIGVFLHVHGNYESGPLDAVYGERWDTMSAPSKWWAAISQQVGPSPAIVPLVLAQVAALVFVGMGKARGAVGAGSTRRQDLGDER